jgi:hypothetical protein
MYLKDKNFDPIFGEHGKINQIAPTYLESFDKTGFFPGFAGMLVEYWAGIN